MYQNTEVCMWDKIKKYLPSYVIAIAIPLAVGALSALITMGNMQIYKELNAPPLAPPSWLFPVVWTVLYVLMGVSSAMVYNNREIDPVAARSGLTFYAVSLILNFGWSIIFFNMKSFLLAFIWLIVLFYTIIKTVLYYVKVVPIAGYLQIPYAVWVAFAGYLNIAIYLLN